MAYGPEEFDLLLPTLQASVLHYTTGSCGVFSFARSISKRPWMVVNHL